MTLSANVAEKFTKYLVHPGPEVAAYEAAATVSDLREQAVRAPQYVGEITGLTAAAEQAKQVPVFVVDRARWAGEVGKFVDAMLRRAQDARFGLIGGIASAPMLAFAATKVLGQFDSFGANVDTIDTNLFDDTAAVDITKTKLMLVAPNIARFRASYNLDQRDVALWVCVHEMTHAVQFIQAPWLEKYLLQQVDLVFQSDDPDLGAVTEQMQNVMSVLEGHAQYVMNTVPLQAMPSRNAIIRSLAKKRENTSLIQSFLTKLFGFNHKAEQYRRGEDFVNYVVEHAGMEAFNRVWDAPENLPSSAEFADPSLWLARLEIEVG